MRYFFNDVEVTEAEYKELISKSVPDVPAKFVQVVPNVKAEPKKDAIDMSVDTGRDVADNNIAP